MKNWLERMQELADSYPDAVHEVAGGLAVALRRVTVGGIEVIGPPNAAESEFERYDGETDEEFAEAKRAYAALFARLRD